MKRMIICAILVSLLQAGRAQISVIGTATPAGDWNTDYDMVQDAGNPSVFRLNTYLAAGELKFREGHAWTNNWGDVDFPAGIAILAGPNIPVEAGFYTITFDTTSLAYLFSSGNVGINNENPAVSLDIAGALAHRAAHLDVTDMAVDLPANVSLLKLTGSPSGPVFLSGSGGADGQRLVLLNATSTQQPVTVFDASFTIEPGETREFVFVAGEGWKPLSPGPGGNINFWVQDGATAAIRNTNQDGLYSTHAGPVSADPGVVSLPVSGTGTRLMWVPDKSVFRAGTVEGLHWDADSLGTWSFAAGLNNIAKGNLSTAFGEDNRVSAYAASAIGSLNAAAGDYGVALGRQNTANGHAAIAFGLQNMASGLSAVAMGRQNAATGLSATALGADNLSAGHHATAIGKNTYARSYASLALGRWNDTIAESQLTTWLPEDPLVTIGNGTGANNLSNAVTILKNGRVGIGNAPEAKEPEAMLVVDNGPSYTHAIRCRGAILSYGVDGHFPPMGSGTRLMWIPTLSAFRAGVANGDRWDPGNVGAGSVAFGTSTMASGDQSMAFGWFTTADGWSSFACGKESWAAAHLSSAMGENCLARGYASTVVGMYNDPVLAEVQTSPTPATPLFIVGKGESGNLSNVLTVLKSGNIGMGNAAEAKSPDVRLVVDGYTRLGTPSENAPAVKMKKLTDTGPTNNGTKAILHGLDAAKILSVSILTESSQGSAETVPPNFTANPGLEYQYLVRTNDIFIINTIGNSYQIHQRPVRILITYEE